MAVGSRAGKKQGKNAEKGSAGEPGGAEKALIKARAKLDKRRRQVEKALALVASLEIRSLQQLPRASKPASARSAPAKASPARTAPTKASPAKASVAKRAPAKASAAKAYPPRASGRATAKATPGSATATTPTAASAGAAPRRRSVKPPSAGTRAPDR
jgi:hypothetical protein